MEKQVKFWNIDTSSCAQNTKTRGATHLAKKLTDWTKECQDATREHTLYYSDMPPNSQKYVIYGNNICSVRALKKLKLTEKG